MGIYLPNMEMPKSCFACNFRKVWDDGVQCLASKGLWMDYDGKHQACPLVPVPPHGRLIDADRVSLEGGPYEYDEWCKWALDQYQDAPTIIPAEEGE